MANLNTRQTEQVREHIQGSMLALMLNEYALTGKYNGAKVDPSRIRAAEILLRKILPDLKATEHEFGDVMQARILEIDRGPPPTF